MKFRRKQTVHYHIRAEHIPPGCRALIQVPLTTSPAVAYRLRDELDRRAPGNNYLIVACDRITVDYNPTPTEDTPA